MDTIEIGKRIRKAIEELFDGYPLFNVYFLCNEQTDIYKCCVEIYNEGLEVTNSKYARRLFYTLKFYNANYIVKPGCPYLTISFPIDMNNVDAMCGYIRMRGTYV